MVFRGILGACFNYQVRFYFGKLPKFRYKETWNNNFRKSRLLLDKLVAMATPDNLGNQK